MSKIQNKLLLRLNIKRAEIQLKISHIFMKIANIFDFISNKLVPSPIWNCVNPESKNKVFQIIGPMDTFHGRYYHELFIDGVDYQHELGNIETKVYESLEELKEKHGKCWQGCGVVKVTIKVLKEEWVVKQDLFNPKNLVEYKPKGKKNAKRRSKRNDSKTR